MDGGTQGQHSVRGLAGFCAIRAGPSHARQAGGGAASPSIRGPTFAGVPSCRFAAVSMQTAMASRGPRPGCLGLAHGVGGVGHASVDRGRPVPAAPGPTDRSFSLMRRGDCVKKWLSRGRLSGIFASVSLPSACFVAPGTRTHVSCEGLFEGEGQASGGSGSPEVHSCICPAAVQMASRCWCVARVSGCSLAVCGSIADPHMLACMPGWAAARQ